jgi:DNA polymerase
MSSAPTVESELSRCLRELAESLKWQAELGALGLPPQRGAPTAQVATPRSTPAAMGAGDAATPSQPETVPSAPPKDALAQSHRSQGSPAAAPESRAPRRQPPEEVLRRVRDELGDCQRCKLAGGRTHLVFGVGNAGADLMFIGEAPGFHEDRQGVPFVGRAGQLLTRMIAAMGLTRDDVYIANIIKCRPPKNRDPEIDEITACEPFLLKQIDAIEPRVIVTLGRYAAQTLLRVRTPITRLRGRWKTYHGVKLMPTLHPAYLLRNPNAKKDTWHDLQMVMEVLGLERPSRRGG